MLIERFIYYRYKIVINDTITGANSKDFDRVEEEI
jgi:hypothetical protein